MLPAPFDPRIPYSPFDPRIPYSLQIALKTIVHQAFRHGDTKARIAGDVVTGLTLTMEWSEV
jgi:hypothetical protein